MKATPRKQRITVERKVLRRDEYGGEIEVWEYHCRQYAAVFWGSGNENRVAAQEQAAQTVSFEVVSTAKTRSVTPVDRIIFAGRQWDIHSVQPIGLNRDHRWTCAVHDGVELDDGSLT